MMMRVLSVCSGIGADAVAWHPLGWETVAFAEIDPHASAVLAKHYPEVPNLGDFTKIQPDDVGPVDLLVGGTPCQSFSVAGLRGGMDDNRGNLALEFCRLIGRLRPRWIVWENVPGVFSSDGGRSYRAIIEGLWECGYSTCWRILDAQFVRVESHPRAVPQRRRRVFVVGHIGDDWRPPVAVLLEPEGLRRDSSPSRDKGASVAALTARGVGTCGPDDNQAQAGHLVSPLLTSNIYGDHESREGLLIAGTVSAKWAKGSGGPSGDECQNLVVDALPAIAFTSKDHGADLAEEVSPTLRSMAHDKSHQSGGGQVSVAIGLQGNASEPIVADECSPTLDQKGDQMAVAIDTRQDPNVYIEHTGAHVSESPPHGVAVLEVRGRGDGRNLEVRADGTANALRAASGGRDSMGVGAIHSGMTVRRITPLEAERLMGLPDHYTSVPYRGKPMADGPRYRLLGNSIAINCLRWIGERIALWESLKEKA